MQVLPMRARAQARPASAASEPLLEPPYVQALRVHYYEQLAKHPWRAFAWELLLPGAGNFYVGLYVPAAATLAVSLAGASLWLAGALGDHTTLERVGIASFALGRGYGLVSAPIGAALLNAAFRKQLGLHARF